MGILDRLFGSSPRRETRHTGAVDVPSTRSDLRENESQSEMMALFDRSRELLKEATRLKKEHPQEAIQKIREAIQACPEKVLEDYFKLSSYLTAAGQFNDAFAVLRKLGTEESPQDYFFLNMNLSSIHAEMAKVVFREKKWSAFVYSPAAT